ncbi:MAG TPA: phage tail sheath C-terminal domain-containing protein [Edaphocola sp.]|nr:phage tail sheath C-terminal domain-containing protein [Edaphocola sp.]
MAFNYKTPGVYLEEIVKLPPSVASVETAIPCFFGKTEKATEVLASDLIGVSKKINSLADYEALYGLPDIAKATVNIELNMPSVASLTDTYYNNMYYAIKHYFDNGGGPCYVHSLGKYSNTLTPNDYKNEILKLDLVDEVTLVVLPDLSGLKNIDNVYDVYNNAMMKSAALKDKFVIIDVIQELTGLKIDASKSKSSFRDKISNNIDDIKYGAAYFPFVQTTYQYDFNSATVKMNFSTDVMSISPSCKLLNGLDYGISKSLFAINNVLTLFNDDYFKNIQTDSFQKKTSEISGKINSILSYFIDSEQQTLIDNAKLLTDQITVQGNAAKNTLPDPLVKFDYSDTAAKEKANLLKQLQDKTLSLYNSYGVLVPTVDIDNFTKFNTTFLSLITPFFNSAFEAKLKEAFLNIPLLLPPSPSIAGVYASVDRNRGVWKAPANVSLNSVVKPAVLLSDIDQGDFNIDSENGKSINCIRQFVGRGNLVWGARTLAGNNNEWKYVNVRRFFNMAEESCENAARQFVFEPNDANTWVRVKGMIGNYLTNLWRVGALQGAKPEQAFYVAVGLNETMTQDDILNGLMIVEIGLAVVRPAEFIILRFSHKLALS